jgi:hypothetical protein
MLKRHRKYAGAVTCDEVQSSKSEVQTNSKVQTSELYGAGIAPVPVWNWFFCLNFELRALNFILIDPASFAILRI